MSKYGVISGLYFRVFGLNTEKILRTENKILCIQSQFTKKRTKNNFVFGDFSSKDSLRMYTTIIFKDHTGSNNSKLQCVVLISKTLRVLILKTLQVHYLDIFYFNITSAI